MKKTFWDKRIPTLLSIGIIGISIIITSFVLRTQTNIVSKADITQTPQNVKITNISEKSFTISYTTEVPNIASISFGTDEDLGQTAIDGKDQEKGVIRPRLIHSFTLKNLKPQTKYFFTIVSGGNTFLNNDLPYEATTAPTPQITLENQLPIQGKVILPTGEAPGEALVYVTTDKSQEISTLTQENGEYSLSLNSLLLKDLSYPIILDQNDIVRITVTDGKRNSNILLLAKQIKNIPVVTLFNNYDFTLEEDAAATESADLVGFSSIETSPTPTPTPTPTPIAVSTPTPTPTPTPTTVPTTPPSPTPSPTSLQDTPLGNQSILAAGVAGIAISVFGILLFTSTRGGIFS